MKYITRKDDLAALPLSKRLYNCLRNRGIHTIGAMIDYPKEHSWTTIRNMGQKSIDEANQWLEVIVTGETGYYLIDDNAEISEQPNPEANSDSEKSENDPLHTAIVDMPFSVRAKNCLLSAGITSVSQLVGITEEELLGMKNMGRVSAREILRTLEEFVNQETEIQTPSQETPKAEPPSRNMELADELRKTLGGDLSSYLREVLKVETDYPEAQGETYYYRLYESAFLREMLKDKILALLEANEDGLTRKVYSNSCQII